MELSYMTIEAYKDPQMNTKIGSYVVMLNPETYTHSYTVNYSDKQSPGSPNVSAKYDKSPPSEVSFDLVFDGTGVVNKKVTNLIDEIEKFRKIVYDYNGEIHKSNYLKLTWGANPEFQCNLVSMSITYKLFRPDGTPLRAEVKVSFKNFEDPEVIEKEAEKESPDMTQVVTVVAGDTLPSMTYRAYGEKIHYMKVARFNGLTNFRNLKPGTKITFPPLV